MLFIFPASEIEWVRSEWGANLGKNTVGKTNPCQTSFQQFQNHDDFSKDEVVEVLDSKYI